MDTHTFNAALTLIRLGLSEDLASAGDVTSAITIPPASRVRARVIARQPGVIAGLPLVAGVYAELDADVRFYGRVSDGDAVTEGAVLCELEGRARSILTGERTALNFLQHLSGIATLTRQFVQAVAHTQALILDTRKTLPGYRLLEKYAVRQGGGHNHRMGLYDTLLIKNNHISAAGGVTAAIRAARTSTEAAGLPLIVEVRDFAQLDEALAQRVDRILLDNMDPEQIAQAVQIVAGRVPLEASGNMTLARVRAVAETGVDYISVGALTHSAPALDLSMRVQGLA